MTVKTSYQKKCITDIIHENQTHKTISSLFDEVATDPLIHLLCVDYYVCTAMALSESKTYGKPVVRRNLCLL